MRICGACPPRARAPRRTQQAFATAGFAAPSLLRLELPKLTRWFLVAFVFGFVFISLFAAVRASAEYARRKAESEGASPVPEEWQLTALLVLAVLCLVYAYCIAILAGVSIGIDAWWNGAAVALQLAVKGALKLVDPLLGKANSLIKASSSHGVAL